MENKKEWIWLSLLGIGDKKLEKLLEKYVKNMELQVLYAMKW